MELKTSIKKHQISQKDENRLPDVYLKIILKKDYNGKYDSSKEDIILGVRTNNSIKASQDKSQIIDSNIQTLEKWTNQFMSHPCQKQLFVSS